MLTKVSNVMSLLVVSLMSFSAYAIEPFEADCSADKSYRYGMFVLENGKVLEDGWQVEGWWGDDTIIWTGGDTVTLNYGKMSLEIISTEGTILRAISITWKNIYLLTLDTSLNTAALTQHQNIAEAGSHQMKARTAGLKCTFKPIQ